MIFLRIRNPKDTGQEPVANLQATSPLPGKVWIGYWEKNLHGKGCPALEQAARGSGRVTIPAWRDLKHLQMWGMG